MQVRSPLTAAIAGLAYILESQCPKSIMPSHFKNDFWEILLWHAMRRLARIISIAFLMSPVKLYASPMPQYTMPTCQTFQKSVCPFPISRHHSEHSLRSFEKANHFVVSHLFCYCQTLLVTVQGRLGNFRKVSVPKMLTLSSHYVLTIENSCLMVVQRAMC